MPSHALSLLRELIRANSENPPGNEYEAAMIVKREMDSIGMRTGIHEFAKGRPNIVGVLRGSPGGKKLLLTTHIDTVPAGKGWKRDPFGAEVRNGRVYGRGATDSKCNVVACLEAARRVAGSGFGGELIVAITSDEETGSRYGLKPLLDKGIIRPDYSLVVDGHGFEVVVAQKGLVQFRVTVYGRKAHGAYPWLGDNAIDKASDIICRLREYRFSFRKNPLLKPPSMNIGVIRGGDKVNIVPDCCEFEVDLRYLPGMDSRKIMGDIRKIIEKTTRRYNIEVMDEQKPYQIERNNPIVTTLIKSLSKHRKGAEATGSEGATPVSFFRSNATSTGFGEPCVAHMTDEFVKIRNVEDGASALHDFISEFLR